MELLKSAKDKAFWRRVRTDIKYSDHIARVKKLYAESKTLPVPSLSFSDRNTFNITGSRDEFEKPYFKRRQYLTACALLALIYPEADGYLRELQDVIWAVCEEFSWAMPAHIHLSDSPAEISIDLFAAETGLSLAEICYLLSDRLDGEVVRRVRGEVERRIINSYLATTYWWESSENNWAAVCAGCVAGTFMYVAPERFSSVSKRIYGTMDCFLRSFTDDGVCQEGLGYWQYGFGTFVWFADLLSQFTDGSKDYFASDEVKKIAQYAQKNFICGNQAVSFSDCSRSAKVHGALMSFLAKKYPSYVHVFDKENRDMIDGSTISTHGNWIKCIRDFIYFDASDEVKRLEKQNYDLLGSGQVIVNADNYSLAVKANHNDEPHNHNDVGTFILSTEKGQVFCDYGMGRYSKDYFSEKRYDILCTSSRGHSVPIINGGYQKAGRRYCGTIAHEGNEITVQMAGAYGQADLKSVKRVFRYFEDKVELTDTFLSENDRAEYIDRFVTLTAPEIFDGYVAVENVRLYFDKTCVSVSVSFEEQEIHGPSGKTETVYLLDFALNDGVDSVKFVFEIV